MNIDGRPYRTIWIDTASDSLTIIDQTALPHRFQTVVLPTVEEVCRAIREMLVRGAGLIGATAGYGMWVAAATCPAPVRASSDQFYHWILQSREALRATRPTASNLAWALDRQSKVLEQHVLSSPAVIIAALRAEAEAIADEDAEFCRRLGEHGCEIIRAIAAKKNGAPVNILTHCNAGWLAFVDFGSALSPIYAAHNAGIPVHVWVDETRPRNQGASLTAWELGKHGVPHDLIVDNAGGHIMQHGMVDMVITGADRVTRCGDAANKIGTYLKALAAHDNAIPFYVALPSSTFDFRLCNGVADIPIEERNADEVRVMSGVNAAGQIESVRICPDFTSARNWAFDVTPGRLITGLITERGVCAATEAGVVGMFPELGGE